MNTMDRDGWVVTPPVIHAGETDRLREALEPALVAAGERGGIRNLLGYHEVVRDLASDGPVREAAAAILGPDCGAVRAILFDKTPTTNWKVVCHQDLTIAVAAGCAAPGYGPWSRKDGVIHVQPPVSVLEQMVAVRLHLDRCTAENGPVRVISGSHRAGKLPPEAIDEWRSRVPATECLVELGGLLIIRPLLLHASSKATAPRRRRVLHIEFGPPQLAEGLRWHTWVPQRCFP